jgi:hypothetical protein
MRAENLLTPDDFAGAAGRQRAKLQAKRPRRRLGVRQLVRRSRPKSRIPKKANGCCLRHKLVQQSQPLGLQQIGQDVDAGDVSARSVVALDETGLAGSLPMTNTIGIPEQVAELAPLQKVSQPRQARSARAKFVKLAGY